MALKNYLSEKTYSVIDSIQYSKQSSWLRFTLKIYDENKTVELASRSFDISKGRSYRSVKDFLSEPPKDPVMGEYFVVRKDQEATGAWKGREGLLATFNNKNEWEFWILGPGETFYSIANDDYFLLNHETQETRRVYPLDDYRLWNKFFNTQLIFADNSNIFKQVYTFLKKQPGFENVIDA